MSTLVCKVCGATVELISNEFAHGLSSLFERGVLEPPPTEGWVVTMAPASPARPYQLGQAWCPEHRHLAP